jgi:hypothetical protein
LFLNWDYSRCIHGSCWEPAKDNALDSVRLNLRLPSVLRIRIALIDADPGSACLFDADPDLTFYFDANSDPSFQIRAQNLEKVLKETHFPFIMAGHLHIDPDPDPVNHFNPDPAFQVKTDPDPTLKFSADPDPQNF